jgi:hypothetical protein
MKLQHGPRYSVAAPGDRRPASGPGERRGELVASDRPHPPGGGIRPRRVNKPPVNRRQGMFLLVAHEMIAAAGDDRMHPGPYLLTIRRRWSRLRQLREA